MYIPVNGAKLRLNRLPSKCPFCHNSVTPNKLYGYLCKDALEVYMSCPNYECEKSFIGYYSKTSDFWSFSGQTTIGSLKGKKFDKIILDISPSFIKIYNEAFKAEQQKLYEICGVGYRKSFEFLIKDYVILNNKHERDKIERMFLGNCIDEYINDDRIKLVSKRAVWLGNDETHYIRKWEGRNLEDLKNLIELAVHWIMMDNLTSQFEKEMPDKS